MKTRILILFTLMCSGCNTKQFVKLYGQYSTKSEFVNGNSVHAISLMTDKYGAKKINDNPGGLIASKNCSYNDTEIVGSVMSTSLGYVDQPRPGAAAVYDAKSGAYKIKIIVDDDFDEWKKSGSFCAYYHASKAWFSSEVYSNMLRFQ